MIATLKYSSKPGAPERAVAEHSKQAFTNPKTTKPLNALKNVLGDTIQEPLQRLFLDEKRKPLRGLSNANRIIDAPEDGFIVEID
ncbi:hypothetical protein [Streptomyces sp. NRRL S-237]|uniref:hypothetical protein n=1 Tax=Streptomyces sp. NRRL S-237 TaxID=1463895 RepID=UPI0004C777DB|nr:hypothetical protein [Streptomyces sp. NRRL S-237]